MGEDPKGDIQLHQRLREVGPFEDWRARPAEGLGLPASVLARRVSAHYTERRDLHARLRVARDLADAVQAPRILVACGIHRSDSGALLQISHDPGGVDLGRSPVATDGDPLPLVAALWVGMQLLDGLSHAHGLGVVHGNLSPAAIWLRPDGGALLDFGLAMSPAHPDRHDTEPVDLRFVNPAWLEADRFHPRGDVYALTALLWWLMTGRPYRTSPREAPHRPLGELLPKVPARLEAAFRYGLGQSEDVHPAATPLFDALRYVFYRDLDGDHTAAAESVGAWLAPHLEVPDGPSLLGAESVLGTFLRAPTSRVAGTPDLVGAQTVATTESPFDPPALDVPTAATALLAEPSGGIDTPASDLVGTPLVAGLAGSAPGPPAAPAPAASRPGAPTVAVTAGGGEGTPSGRPEEPETVATDGERVPTSAEPDPPAWLEWGAFVLGGVVTASLLWWGQGR